MSTPAADAIAPGALGVDALRIARESPTCTLELARLLASEAEPCVLVLKLSDSPLAGPSRHAHTIEEAVRALGAMVVAHFTAALSILASTRAGRCEALDRERFWSQSLATALASQALCAPERAFPPEEIFTCGLLCRVGELALAQRDPVAYAGIRAQVQEWDRTRLAELERAHFASDHAETSAALLRAWGLQTTYVEATRRCARADEAAVDGSRTTALAHLLALAELMGMACAATPEDRQALTPRILAVAAEQGRSAGEMVALMDAVAAQWLEWGQLLELPTQPVPAFAEAVEHARHAAIQAQSRQALRVLIVDDEPIALKTLARQLSRAGHEVITAVDGREALRLMPEHMPHMLITDWMMPEMDGLSLCETLRGMRLGQLLYIIMLTAREDAEQVVEAFDAGADDYVVKPLNPRVLEARMRAGERIIRLHMEVERERQEAQRYLEELADMNRRLHESAMTDTLTGLPNRRHAQDHLATEWASAERTGLPLACLIVDVDHFKRFNDDFGHDTGDEVLRVSASVLRAAARSSDTVCRFGGEEFLVICTDTDEAAARKLGERLRADTAAHRFDNVDYVLTISVGAAVRTPAMSDPGALLRAADQALLEAKREGRNRVKFA